MDELDQNFSSESWDLIPTSREEFNSRLEQFPDYNADMDMDSDDYEFVVHYTDPLGVYIGTIKVSDGETEYLIPESDTHSEAETIRSRFL